MKKAVANFAGSALSRDQLKSVKGGTIYCTCDYGWTYQSGKCSGSSISQCVSFGCGPGGRIKGCAQT